MCKFTLYKLNIFFLLKYIFVFYDDVLTVFVKLDTIFFSSKNRNVLMLL